jgi:hypothetical protein
MPHRFRLLLPDHEEHDVTRSPQRRRRQCHTRDVRPLDREGEAFFLLECLMVREERRGMSVGADAEQYEVERDAPKVVVVAARSFVRSTLAEDAVDRARRRGKAVQQRLAY